MQVIIEKDSYKKTYTFVGPLFFASDRSFKNHFLVAEDPEAVFVDLTKATLHDYSACAALNTLGDRYTDVGKAFTVYISGTESTRLLKLLGKKLSDNVTVIY